MTALHEHARHAQARSLELQRQSALVMEAALRSAADAQLFRDEAARVAKLEAEVAGLRKAMASRATIEQAKGILMATARCTPEEAFRLLVRQSQHENRKLRAVAEELVARQAPEGQPRGSG
jgi:AmiR/NasT family two-component response regulator